MSDLKSTITTISEAVHNKFLSSNLTLSLAESCTGGLLASTITKLSGASKYFLGSIVCYSNDVKENLLNVSKNTLNNFGAVSPQTASELAVNCSNIFKTNIAISITGIAGPSGGTSEKPMGTVYFGFYNQGKLIVDRQIFSGNRTEIQEKSVIFALGYLKELMSS